MKKEIKPYKQTGPTCAIACMMMVLHYNGLLDSYSNEEETRLYEMYKSKSMGGTPFSALAFHLGKSGLKTELYHSEKNYFSNEKKLISEYIFNYALEEYKEYISKAKKYRLIKRKIKRRKIINCCWQERKFFTCYINMRI